VKLRDILEWSARLAGCDAVPPDSQVYVESPADVHRLLFGVDIDVGEILYARDASYDAVLAHHPVGDRAQLDLALVVRRQVQQMLDEGVPRQTAEAAVAQRLQRPQRALHVANVNRVVDTARLIGLPLANIHLACDIIGRQTIVDLLAERAGPGSTVADAIAWLEEFPEMKAAYTRPEAWVGEPRHRLGRYTVAMAGGISGGHPAFSEYFRAGVDTIFAMHVPEEDLARLRDDPLAQGRTLVVTGHMSTDSIGINRVIAGLEEQGIAVTRTSGVITP
jgi:putative NIF3 family GTP cyclohydrolase 1 type 2